MTVSEPIRAWWFSCVSRELRYCDRRRAEIGVTHSVRVTPRVGECGLHGSWNIIPALKYAGGPVAWLVELSGEVSEGGEQLAAQKRKYIAGGVNVSAALSAFSRWCALQVADLWDAPLPVRDWLESGGERESLRVAARNSMWRFEARLHAPSQRSAAWSAYRTLLLPDFITARDSAQDAVNAVSHAEGQGWYAAWRNQNTRLTEMVSEAIGVEAES